MDADGRWQILKLHVEDQVPLAVLARHYGIGLRTLERWHARYCAAGLEGLGPTARPDAGGWRSLGKTLDPDDFTDAQAIAAITRVTRGTSDSSNASSPKSNAS